MRFSLFVLLAFAAGVACGRGFNLPAWLLSDTLSLYVLCLLVTVVGIHSGSNPKVFTPVLKQPVKLAFVPIATAAGSIIGAGLIALAINPLSFRQGAAVGAGLGYYSLSSLIIGQVEGESLAVVALMANISRELLTLVAAPVIAARLGGLALVASGGATSMDTTLAVVNRWAGPAFTVAAVFSGVTLSVAVPFLVRLVLG